MGTESKQDIKKTFKPTLSALEVDFTLTLHGSIDLSTDLMFQKPTTAPAGAPAPGGTGLFGSATGTSSNAGANTGGLFGGSSTAGSAPSNTTAPSTANTAPGTASAATGVTTAANTTAPGKNQPIAQGIRDDNAPSHRLLKDLIESANNLPKASNSDMGGINLTLNELHKKTQQLRKSSPDKPTNFTKAHYLLASSGISAEEIENELNTINIPISDQHKSRINKFENHPEQARRGHFRHILQVQQQYEQQHKHDHRSDMETDSQMIVAHDSNQDSSQVSKFKADHQVLPLANLDNYLNAKKDENILSAIEQSLLSAFNDFDQFINQNISIDWKVRRDELRKSFGVIATSETKRAKVGSNNSINWNNKSLPGHYNILTPLKTKGQTSSSLRQITREKFENHAKVIYQLNEARLANKFFPICLNFEELNKSNVDFKSKQVSETWKILSDLTLEKSVKTNQEQKFFESYQSLGFNERNDLNKKIIKNSKNYLEHQFFNYMDEIYIKDDKKSNEFLPANNINKVSYFINKIIAKNSDHEFIDKTLNVNGVPIWALIFYLFRSGLYNDALQLVNSNRDAFTKFDKNFPIYLSKFVKNNGWGLPSDLQIKISNEFNQQFQYINEDSNDFDAYKYSVYKIIGKCDLSKKSLPQSINLSIEDWLWFHLGIINEYTNETTSTIIYENYSLENLQQKIISLGPKKFNSSSNNPLYLKSLILVGLFELAIQYTYESINECDSVHLSIGLCYYGLLRISSFNNKDDLITINSNDEYELNFSRLLGSYTRSFKISDPKVASQYLILIAMSKGGNNKEEFSKCHEALRELILISREFNLLLGELNQNNGDKIPGILEKQRSLIGLSDLSQFYHQIIETSSIRCEEEGRIFDALLLYQLCQDFDTVVSLINRLLSEILSTSELDKPLIENGNYQNINGEVKQADTTDNNIILLSQHIMKIFNNNSFILDKISSSKKQTNELLLPIISIRDSFYNKNWHQTLLQIKQLGLIPINENDGLLEIRKAVELLSQNMDDDLVKAIPSLLIMVMTSVSQLNYSILTKRYQNSSNEREESNRLKAVAKNCMIYAGMVQYKMPRETYSLLINLESLL